MDAIALFQNRNIYVQITIDEAISEAITPPPIITSRFRQLFHVENVSLLQSALSSPSIGGTNGFVPVAKIISFGINSLIDLNF